MKHSRILIAVALPVLALVILTLALASCNEGGEKIPFDRKKAKEHIISWDLADSMRTGFQNGRDSLIRVLECDTTRYIEMFRLPTAEMFNRDAIIALLDAEGAENVRIYLGRDTRDSGKIKLVLVPADKNGKDIKTNLLSGKTPMTRKAGAQANGEGEGDGEEEGEDGGFQAIEVGQRCPSFCN